MNFQRESISEQCVQKGPNSHVRGIIVVGDYASEACLSGASTEYVPNRDSSENRHMYSSLILLCERPHCCTAVQEQ